MTAAVPQEAKPRSGPVFGPVVSLMLGRTLAFAATFFIPVILARVFDPSRFATYKQLFLIHSTVFLIAQVGMATSLYYFLPRSPQDAGKFIANSLGFLAAMGLAGFGAIMLAAPHLAHWMNNPELERYVFWIGLYIFLMMISSPLEIVLIARGRFLWASASYALSDLARAAASILPVYFFRELDGLLKGLAVVALIRAGISLVYFQKEFGSTFRFDKLLLRNQLAYAMPFALAVVVEIVQGNLPQYAVSSMTTPATFAVFAVGCLSIPLVDFAASPTSDVMMVRMQENLTASKLPAVLEIWHETTRKLALLFFPLAALVIVAAKQIILLLFTARYIAAVPIFMLWTLSIPMTTFQVDGVLRVFAQTRLLLVLNIVRLVIMAGLIQWSLARFSLIGPVLVILLATIAFKVGALAKMRALLNVSALQLLPWANLAAIAGASAAAAGAAWALQTQLHGKPIPILSAVTAVHVILYTAIVWQFNLMSASERLAVTQRAKKLFMKHGKG